MPEKPPIGLVSKVTSFFKDHPKELMVMGISIQRLEPYSRPSRVQPHQICDPQNMGNHSVLPIGSFHLCSKKDELSLQRCYDK